MPKGLLSALDSFQWMSLFLPLLFYSSILTCRPWKVNCEGGVPPVSVKKTRQLLFSSNFFLVQSSCSLYDHWTFFAKNKDLTCGLCSYIEHWWISCCLHNEPWSYNNFNFNKNQNSIFEERQATRSNEMLCTRNNTLRSQNLEYKVAVALHI